MKKYVKIIFTINIILVLFLWGSFLFHESNLEIALRQDSRCEIITDYQVRTYENADAPIGITQEYRWTLKDVPLHDGCVTFNIVHQEVEIFVDDTLVYSLSSNENNLFTNTTGYQWAKAFLYASDEGKEIRVVIHPIYESSLGNDLVFYYGNHDAISHHLIRNDIPIIVLGIFAIVLGIALIAFCAVCLQRPEIDKSICMLGFFSIFAGLWKMTDMLSASIIFPYPVALSGIAIISLSMMVTSYIYFIRSKCDKSRHLAWNILCIICSSVSILTILLQLLGIMHLRESLIIVHIMIGIAIISVIALLIREVYQTKLTRNLKITFFCCFLCLCGTAVDMLVFYVTGYSGNMIHCLLSFIIYVILMGIVSVRDALRLIQRGKDAQRFEKMAMQDPLTELFSRSYYSDYIIRHNMEQKDCFIVMMDVNNLKLCNDTAGHEQGDRLLQNAAGIIQHAFLPNGKCIRMGGDEFCVLLRHITKEECVHCLEEFDKLLALFNQSYPDEFPVEIAYGYAHFDSSQDFEFADTVRRADKMMYEKKVAMKAKTV